MIPALLLLGALAANPAGAQIDDLATVAGASVQTNAAGATVEIAVAADAAPDLAAPGGYAYVGVFLPVETGQLGWIIW